MSEIFIYQILPHYAKREDLDPGFLVLDNTSQERLDWYEYWPIRKFLLKEPLQADSFYGFLSPRFNQKTGLGAAAVREIVSCDRNATDIVLFSHSPEKTAYYWNAFEYGEFCHPGLFNLATQFFERIGQPTDLKELVTHSGNEVSSNFMIAKPRFWMVWLGIVEQMIAIAESPTDPLGAELRKPTTYRGERDAQMKVFVLERIATWILARDPGFAVRVRDPIVSRTRLYKLPGAIVCDALKVAYLADGRQEKFRIVFNLISKLGRVFSLHIRLGNLLGIKAVRLCLESLSSRWTSSERSR
ncbi:MAG TPA: hypothetical protein VNZ02_02865 [Steroidobacteraceae bacterium]|jgi:hypothetical protein|nr:hypothetical protein [Steroidobacteraceae bacterium]